MIIYRSASTDPAWNLALEEFFFRRIPAGQSFCMLWQNHNTVVIGKNQNTLQEIDSDYVEQQGIRVVRRLSGGGAVYHDLGNLNFTFITDAPENGQIDLHRFCVPIAETLRSFGVEAVISGRNDITVDGKKFSGNAQYVQNGRVMHHGTMMFDSDLTVLSHVLRPDPDKIASKAIRSVSSRVTNLKSYLPADVSMEQFIERLLQYLSVQEPAEYISLTEAELEDIRCRKESRYDTWEWNWGRSPAFSWRGGRRIEGCGRVNLQLRVDAGCIRDLQISGDFFGNRDIRELCGVLDGCPFRRDAVVKRLQETDLESYIHNISAEAFSSLLPA